MSLFLPIMASVIGLFVIYQTLLAQNIINETNSFFIYKAFSLSALLVFIVITTKRLAYARVLRRRMKWLSTWAVLLYVSDALFL